MELKYTQALIKLLPKGKLWDVKPGSVFYRLLEGLAKEFNRIEDRSNELVNEASAGTATETLSEWGKEYGLRLKNSLTVQEKRAQILVKLRDQGGASLDYLRAQISALGFEAVVSNDSYAAHAPIVAGSSVRSKKWDTALLIDVQKRYERQASVQDLTDLREYLNNIAPASMYIGVKSA